MSVDRAKGDENAREAIKGLHLILMDIKVPLFSGPVSSQLQGLVGELLAKKYSEENLSFLQDVHKLSLKDRNAKGIDRLMRTYIVPNSDRQINIETAVSKALMAQAKEKPLSLQDFLPAIDEVCTLIKTNLTSLDSSDKQRLLDLCIKQKSLDIIQELNETRAAMQISSKLNSKISPSLEILKTAITGLRGLDLDDAQYVEKFTDILKVHSAQQKLVSTFLKTSPDKSLIEEARNIGEKALKLMGSPIHIEKEKKRFLPSFLQSKPDPEKDARPKVASNRYMLVNKSPYNSPESKTDKTVPKKATNLELPTVLPSLARRKGKGG